MNPGPRVIHRRKLRRARHARLKAQGLCTRCRHACKVDENGKVLSLCSTCMDDQAARAVVWKAAHPEKQKEIARKARKTWRRKQAKNGGCHCCVKPATKHGRCDKHYAKDIERRSKRSPRRPLKIDRRDLLPLTGVRRKTRLWMPAIPPREIGPRCACGNAPMTGLEVCWVCVRERAA